MGRMLLFLVILSSVSVNGDIPTTLEGPFRPVTAPLDRSIVMNTTDLPPNDPRLRKPELELEPQQILVSLSSNYDSVWISWITGEYGTGKDISPLDPGSVQSIVRYKVFGSNIINETSGSSHVYGQHYASENLLDYTSGIIHRVQLKGLEPGKLYQYQCGDPSKLAISDFNYFRTMPIPSPENYPSRIAVAGDIGLTYKTATTFSHMLSNHPELLVLIGGLSYADTYLTNGSSASFSGPNATIESYQPRWDYWGRFMQPLIANVPTVVVGGEHEIELQANDQTFVAFRSRFASPSNENESSSGLYYSFNAGGIHFIMINPYVSYSKTCMNNPIPFLTMICPSSTGTLPTCTDNSSSEQRQWLENDLKNFNRSVTPWLIAAWYSPWYSTYSDRYGEAECMRIELENLLHSYGTDIIFNAQVHAYERSNRVYNYTLDHCGALYITLGDGGGGPNLAVDHSEEPGKCPQIYQNCESNGPSCWDKQPAYSAYRESSFGFGLMEVKNESHALWTWHRNQDSYQSAGDIIYIVREPERCNNTTLLMK